MAGIWLSPNPMLLASSTLRRAVPLLLLLRRFPKELHELGIIHVGSKRAFYGLQVHLQTICGELNPRGRAVQLDH